MKQLWLAVVVLAAAIFLWQAGRIWLGGRQTTESNTPVKNEPVAEVAQPTEPALDPTPQTHTVAAGETLNLIGLKYNLRWTSIAALNGLTETSYLKEGMVLKLPLTVSGHIIEVREVPLDMTAAQNSQNDARFGGITWRFDPAEVVRQTVPSDSGILHDTPLEIESKDDAAGTAVITATVSGQVRRIYLTQPITKGPTGVWYIIRTEAYRWPN